MPLEVYETDITYEQEDLSVTVTLNGSGYVLYVRQILDGDEQERLHTYTDTQLEEIKQLVQEIYDNK